ncbi:MAG: SUMF1/EgtB/PvdO family nonheme iron enzyme, partial [Fibrobacteres bacterium]|nr:SUMF1/EgtB/PvdO family nonheme iron enzyme [Fibrobacterota bacterium]
AKVYVDGDTNGTTITDPDQGVLGTIDLNLSMYLGNMNYNSGPNTNAGLDGKLDDVRFYNYVIEKKKIDSLYHLAGYPTTAASAPVITTEPTAQSKRFGESVTFSVIATGNPVPTYQWKKNGISIVGATASSYTIPCIVLADSGTYSVYVSNNQGGLNSSTVSLSVVAPDTVTGMKFISSGTFQMGDSINATPIHSVTLTGFWIDSIEVTQADYEAVTGINPSHFLGDPSRPVESVTWYDAVLYCNARSKRDGRDTVYSYSNVPLQPYNGCSDLTDIVTDFGKNGYRLPTEAEWEYAYRGGTSTAWYWSNTWTQTEANTFCWNSNNSENTTQPVAGKLKNAYGLYDMAGNVLEWCNDRYESYTSDPVTDPTGAINGDDRRLRGGYWENVDYNFRAGFRDGTTPNNKGYNMGFRVVCR